MKKMLIVLFIIVLSFGISVDMTSAKSKKKKSKNVLKIEKVATNKIKKGKKVKFNNINVKVQPKNKTYVIPSNWTNEDVTSFYNNHKNDNIYTVVKGERLTDSGCGYDVWGNYIQYENGEVGTLFTTVLKYQNNRWYKVKDIKGHLSQSVAMKKVNVKTDIIIEEDVWYNQ